MDLKNSEFENVKPEVLISPKYSIMSRRGIGTTRRRIQLPANHFKVTVKAPDAVFYSIMFILLLKIREQLKARESGENWWIGSIKHILLNLLVRSLLMMVRKLCIQLALCHRRSLSSQLCWRRHLRRGIEKRSRQSLQSKTFTVELSYAAKIPLKSIALALKGVDVDNTQDALRVLDIFLRKQAANMGCLLVRQSSFHDDSRNFTDVGAGVIGVRGFRSSFRPTQGGLSLNMDVSTTMIMTPGPVINFLIANQGVREPCYIDWAKAKRKLKKHED